MSEERSKLRLPVKLAFATVGLALTLAAAGCGDDDGPTDASPATDTAVADAGRRDAGVDSGLPIA